MTQLRRMKYMAIASQLPASVVAGFLLGLALDMLFGTKFLRVVFLILGVGGGIYRIFKELSRDN